MFSKIMISGEIEVLTGMHIGTGGEFAAIGAVDSPVSRDKISQLPVIPGSTLTIVPTAATAQSLSPLKAACTILRLADAREAKELIIGFSILSSVFCVVCGT